MFEGRAPFLTSPQESSAFVSLVCRQLETAGYQVMHSFDLQNENAGQQTGADHMEGQANQRACRLVVVLAYGPTGPPVSLMFFGSPQRTSLYLAESGPAEKGACNCDQVAQVLAKSLELHDLSQI